MDNNVTNPMPFGYNADGTVNEQEAEVVRFIFAKRAEYFEHPPQELIDEAFTLAESEGITLTDEEAKEMARLHLLKYIAHEVNATFPGVAYRTMSPEHSPQTNGQIDALYVRNSRLGDATFEEQSEELKRIAKESGYRVISSSNSGFVDQDLFNQVSDIFHNERTKAKIK